MAQHNELGKWGEEVAARILTEKGYRIIARDWKDNHKDLDIVAVADDCLVIVEVKTRRNNDYMAPEQAVDYRKIKNITLAANKFIKMNCIDLPILFDIVAVTGTNDENCVIDHIEDAFMPYMFR